MASEYKRVPEPCEARFRQLDINNLERSKLSAMEAKCLGLARLKTSFFSTKVLYEIKFPPELKGETRYLAGLSLFESRVFPEYLVTARKIRRYEGRELDIGPQLIIALRVDDLESVHFVCSKGCIDCKINARRRMDSFWFSKVLNFWSFYIYSWNRSNPGQGVEDSVDFWKGSSRDIADCTRPTNNARIQSFVNHVLGAYLDNVEFQWHYYARDAVPGTRFSFDIWKHFALMEAQHDVAEAMAAGAEQALATRKHYDCRSILHHSLQNNNSRREVLMGDYPHPGWFVSWIYYHPNKPTWAGKPPEPPATPRGESVMKDVHIYDKAELECQRVPGQVAVRRHSSCSTRSK